MGLLDGAVPIENDDHVLRARRTAASTRIGLGILGVALTLAQPHLVADQALSTAGFAAILLTAIVQRTAPRLPWLRVEESFAGVAAILVIGLGDERVTILTILWLSAVSTGVMARGGRVHWIGRTVVLSALVLPVIRLGYLTVDHAALCVATIGLLLTSGRLTRELNHLLKQARLDADNAETLLLAGDIASRVSGREGIRTQTADRSQEGLALDPGHDAHSELTRLIEGRGLGMAAQPIVDVRTGSIHAYEALARFGEDRSKSPLHWLELAGELGERDALERACLRAALTLFSTRPRGARMSLNLSTPVLLDPLTLNMLGQWKDLRGLIIEITEETLVQSQAQLQTAIEPLRARGAQLAVDDMGAGYSGLRQLIAVHPDYLKLDRTLVSGIDGDEDRAALVGALVGYSEQVGSLLVAEGVETVTELERVRELGVPLVQGFYLGRPVKPWPQLARVSATSVAPDLEALGEKPGKRRAGKSLQPA